MKRSLILWTVVVVSFLAGHALAVQFSHDEHQEYFAEGQNCTACHKPGAKVIVPAKKDCLECHEEDFYGEVSFSGTSTHGPVWSLNHRAPAKSGAIDCSACHEQSYCMECHNSTDFAGNVSFESLSLANAGHDAAQCAAPGSARLGWGGRGCAGAGAIRSI